MNARLSKNIDSEVVAPLLSICIPTYNQPEALRALLANLTSQIDPEVEIVIRDDSTNDVSKKVADLFANKCAIRYFRGKKEGLDVAILFLTREARGQYIWWLGDDRVDEGGVGALLSIIKKNPEISFIFINSRGTIDLKPTFSIAQDKFFRDREEVIEEIVDMLGFISATVFKREKSLSGLDAAERYIGTAWVNLYLILHVLSQEGVYYFLSYPYVISEPRRPEVPQWYDGFKVFAVNFFYIFKAFEGKFRRRSLRRALAHNLRGIWKGIIVYRAKGYIHGLGSYEPKIPILFKLYWDFFEFWLALPFLLLPRFLDKLLYVVYRSVFRH